MVLTGLKGRPELNGTRVKVGRLCTDGESAGRYEVRVGKERIALRSTNMKLVEAPEAAAPAAAADPAAGSETEDNDSSETEEEVADTQERSAAKADEGSSRPRTRPRHLREIGMTRPRHVP